jgi:hypothetical protein
MRSKADVGYRREQEQLAMLYQRCSEKHLHRYLAEFDFRYSNRIALGVDDQDRADKAIRGMVGKRLTYRTYRTYRTTDSSARA